MKDNESLKRTRNKRGLILTVVVARATYLRRSPLRFAPGGMRQLSSELLISIPLRYGENQEIETDALRALLIRSVMQ